MAFPHRRGRPRNTDAADADRGTPELQRKFRLHLTREPVDLLLQQEVITAEQHWCALHFRWLYTLRYGTATPRALDPAEIKGLQHRQNHPDWQREREEEWKAALLVLAASGHYGALRDLCIYNQPARSGTTLDRCRQGLDELVRLWCI